MHKIENILFGIALILFGIASLLIVGLTEWALFAILGIVAPIIGLIVVVVSCIYEEKSSNSKD